MTVGATTVELRIDDAWIDVTNASDDFHVLGGHAGGVHISRGRADEAGRPSPTSARFAFVDTDGRLNGDNPASPWFGKVGRNTQCRVSVGSSVRFVGEISDLRPEWDVTGSRLIVHVEATGPLRRLMQGQRPLKSPATRALAAPENTTDRVAWWPLEEESDATSIGSPAGSPTPSYAGEVSFGGYGDAPSSARMLTFNSSDALIFFSVPEYSSTETRIASLWTLPETSLAANTVLLRLYCTGGTAWIIDLEYRSSVDGDLRLNAYNTAGTLLDSTTVADFSSLILDQHFFLSLGFTQDGTDTDTVLKIINMTATDSDGTEAADTLTGVTVGRIFAITIAEGDCTGASFGQLAVGSAADAFGNWIDPRPFGGIGVRGFTGEPAALRIDRLAAEEGVSASVVGFADDSALMGPQGTADTFLDLIYEAVDADGGILREARDALELEYRTRVNLYNQPPAVTLTYASGHLRPPFLPVYDDLLIRNDVTAARPNGSKARYVIPDGDVDHLTTEDPPAGVGVYDEEIEFNVADDDDLDDLAAWTAHLRSWREQRFPQVTVELARSEFGASLTADILAADAGDHLLIDTTGAPAWVPADEVSLLAQGYEESVAKFTHTLTFNSTPARPWEVETVDGTSTLAVAIDDNDTTLRLATSLGPAWSVDEVPYLVVAGGNAMRVDTVLTATPAFIAAGAADHDVNAALTPALPAGITPDVGQLLLCVAAIRNSGTGTVDEPDGWETIVSFGNVALFGRYYVTGDSAPTVEFTGGAAGADTSAQVCAFSGLSMGLAGGTPARDTKINPTVATLLNSSAQNVAYPALRVFRNGGVVLYLGWKQDDWTSVTSPGDAEIGEPDTTGGDDQGLVWSYDIYTTAADVAAGSFTVTGGANAISRGITLALRPLQTATVTRGINNVSTAVAAGEEVHVWRQAVIAL